MNTHLRVLALCITMIMVQPVVSNCAVIHVEEPQPLELTLGAAVGVDMNQDGMIDLWVRYYGMPICIGAPEGGTYACSQGVTLEFASDLHLLGSPSSLDPIAMLSGQSVGPTSTDGVWLETLTSPISLIYESGNAAWVRQGYPDYTGGLERLAIGFRLAEQQSFFYGYVDVSLASAMPHIEGIFLSDEPNVAVSVIQVPEPSALVLAALTGAVLWTYSRRHKR
jgi:hypothetical protein